ncbi:hypothetical protein HMPREF9554_01882 [Treponema phagedenis F0421]|nr:hypothetical protein HMPREF9554_01882 [Treponema phagedenis F0421]
MADIDLVLSQIEKLSHGFRCRFGSFCTLLGAQKGSGFAFLKKCLSLLSSAGQDIFT